MSTGLPVREIVERDVRRRAAIVARALARIGDEDVLVFGRRVPEHLRHVPRPIAVVHEDAIALRLQKAMRAHERLGRRALQKRARLRIELRSEEIVRRRVAHLEMDGAVERR